LGIADGIALAHKLRKENKITAVFTGEGATSEGDFHEALNVAAVWDLPVMFIIENNGYGLSTPTREQYKCENLADKGIGYGMESHIIDGNNIVEVYTKLHEIAEDMRQNPHPVLIEMKTFRMRGHEEASGTKYIPQELFEEWKIKDQIARFNTYLTEMGILSEEQDAQLRKEIKEEIDTHWKITQDEAGLEANLETELNDVYKPYEYQHFEASTETKNIRFIDAISEGLKQSFERHENLIIMGQDIAEYGCAFKVTEGFVDAFGKDRVRNTPICESIIVSSAAGLSNNKYKSVVEMQFADFVSTG